MGKCSHHFTKTEEPKEREKALQTLQFYDVTITDADAQKYSTGILKYMALCAKVDAGKNHH